MPAPAKETKKHKLYYWRKKRGLRQADCAVMFGTDVYRISRVESSKDKIPSLWVKLARAHDARKRAEAEADPEVLQVTMDDITKALEEATGIERKKFIKLLIGPDVLAAIKNS